MPSGTTSWKSNLLLKAVPDAVEPYYDSERHLRCRPFPFYPKKQTDPYQLIKYRNIGIGDSGLFNYFCPNGFPQGDESGLRMFQSRGYTGEDRMCDLVCDQYPVLQVMSRFGIALGFGDKTIAEVCTASGVDTATFLAVVNLLMNHADGNSLAGEVSVRSLTDYLHNSHDYFLGFRLPAIRRKLIEAVDCSQSDVSFAILRYFDEYVAEVDKHMDYEEKNVFPYVEGLLAGEKGSQYSMEVFRRHHDQIEERLRELKNIIIKYYPTGSTNELNGVLFDIFTCEQELASHNAVENEIFIPAVEQLASADEGQAKRQETLSAREKEIIVCVVKGMANKQIADALCISTHTVITHRRNIAAKLQIHSAAGLTIYAIVNKLVELSEIKETINDPNRE